MFYIKKDNRSIAIPQSQLQRLGEGGIGIVYAIGAVPELDKVNARYPTHWAIKLYKHPEKLTAHDLAKLQTMQQRPPTRLYQSLDGVRYPQFSWVRFLVTNRKGEVVGYAMPQLTDSYSLAPFIYPNEAKNLTDYQKSLNYRVQLCANLSALMADLHAQGHAFIDFKETNIRLLLTKTAEQTAKQKNDDYQGFIACFIDCDDYLISDKTGKVFPCQVLSPEISSPDFYPHKDPKQLDERHDRFVLAIQLFKILNNGIHPFSFIPVSPNIKNLPEQHYHLDYFIEQGWYAYGLNQAQTADILPVKRSLHPFWDNKTRQMFDKAFLSDNPTDRPTAKDWEQHLRQLINERQFSRCERYPDDMSHVHFFGKPCYQCFINSGYDPNFHNDLKKNLTSNFNQGFIKQTIKDKTNIVPVKAKKTGIEPPSTPKVSEQTDTNKANHSKPKFDINSTNKVNNITTKKRSKTVVIVGIILLFFVLASWQLSRQSKPKIQPYLTQTAPLSENQLDDYAKIVKQLPTIKTQLQQLQTTMQQHATDFADLSKADSELLFQHQLYLPNDFFQNVLKVAKQGENDLTKLEKVSYQHDNDVIQQLAKTGFRQADFAYFNELNQQGNATLAKQLNNLAKKYFWEKHDPLSAMFLQAQAVKNQPTHSEYTANLAFYLFKNEIAFARDFNLYALQVPRPPQKPINVYPLELLGAIADQKNNEKQAVGLLLAQYYLSDDKPRRCQAMQRYDKNYPKLVPIAKQVFEILNEQRQAGETVPKVCLN